MRTLLEERWLGSSLDGSSPAPSEGSWVWKMEMRPPVGDMSWWAACRAGPRALWVTWLSLNIEGKEASRSFTSWRNRRRRQRRGDEGGREEETRIKRKRLRRGRGGKYVLHAHT